MVKSLRTAIALAVSVATVVAAAPQAAAAVPGPGAVTPATAADPPASVHTVTLVTGDVVRLATFADGRQEASIDDRGNPGGTDYQTSERDGHVSVTPAGAQPYVAAGQLDPTLFDITELVAEGYQDAASSGLPLLVTAAPAAPGLRAAIPAVPTGATRGRELRSIGAVAVTEQKSHAHDFWTALAGPQPLAAPGSGGAGLRPLGGGVGTIWLDRKVHADATDGVSQIGAPEAWRSGYDGKGVKVAVLDSGYDPHHADLAGRVAASANFSADPDIVDGFGHGTHVAATIAGSGQAASAGGQAGPAGGRGVAPGAQLLVGKVLDHTGGGTLAQAIAGMEWATSQGARVVNLSFGATASPGPDPITKAMDALTASSGTLFVVSAGNGGGATPQDVTSPATADSALAVGAVDGGDRMASFSSHGPRLGDGAPKPEITAPGVDIVAARAAGTTLGEVVDASYTSMSGTSMAAPHVTGAAALLVQRHPDWRADRLKAALVSSAANPHDAPVVAQGAGRVDVPAALGQRVTVDAATVALGQLTADAATRTATVNYTNSGHHPVTLSLSAEARDAGATARRAALTVSPGRLTIPAGGRASAVVRLDPHATAPNTYAGLLDARGGGQELRTPIGFAVTPATHRLTIDGVDHDGKAVLQGNGNAELWNLDTGETFYAFMKQGKPAEVDLPDGRYNVATYLHSLDGHGKETDAAIFVEPELTMDADRALHYDARTANEVRTDTPDPTSPVRIGISYQRTTPTRSLISGIGFFADVERHVYAAPSRPVSTGTFQFFTRWALAAPQLTAAVTGTGGFTLPEPLALDNAPLLDGKHTARLVDGGGGSPDELAGAGARDAVVLLRLGATPAAVAAQLLAASAAGAKAILVAAATPGWAAINGKGSTVPAYQIDATDAQRLRDRLATGAVTLALTGVATSPYQYDLLLPEPGRIPSDVHYTAGDLALAAVQTEFHQPAPVQRGLEDRAGYPDGVDVAFTFPRTVTAAQRRTDYVNTRDVSWRHHAVAESEDLFNPMGSVYGPLRTYRAGERTREVWFPALTRPALPQATPNYPYGTPANRAHDAIRVAIPQYANGDASEYGWVDRNSDRARLTLRRGGTVIGTGTASSQQFTVPGDPGTYQLSLDVARDRFGDRVWWTTSTATSTTWTFRSGRPRGDEPAVLPLVQVGYGIDTDLTNTVRAGQPYPLVLTPGYQPGATGPGRFTLDVAVSYDDGTHWRDAATRGDREVTATLPAAPAGAEFATLRVTARDRDGNRIEQTITRAWRVTR